MAGMDIGTTLKELRLSRGIILEEVEQVTHIALRYLRAIEGNDFAMMPGLVYARAYVRKYAEFLGLDPEPLVSAFNQQVAPVYKLEVEADPTPTPPVNTFMRRRNPWGRAFWAIAIIVLVVIGGLILTNILLPAVKPSGSPTPGPTSPGTVTVSPTQMPIPTGSPSATVSPAAPFPSPSPIPASKEVEVRVTAKESGHILVEADGRTQFDGDIDSEKTYTFRQRNFTITFDDPTHFDLLIDGNLQAIPATGVFQFTAP
jgi:cytoskeletal protein RodZ